MALKPTIYKAQIELADSDRNRFDTLSPTLAQHPSETVERMLVRLLVYCLNFEEELTFTRGLSTTEEPDLWQCNARGEVEKWIEVGQPEEARLRKACGRSPEVLVYAFGSGADTWWSLNQERISKLPRTEVWQFVWADVVAAAETLVARSMQIGVSIVGGTIYLDNGERHCEITPRLLHGSR